MILNIIFLREFWLIIIKIDYIYDLFQLFAKIEFKLNLYIAFLSNATFYRQLK